jgi:hypothetical protein
MTGVVSSFSFVGVNEAEHRPVVHDETTPKTADDAADEKTAETEETELFSKYLAAHARRQLAFDIWPLAFAIFLICIIEVRFNSIPACLPLCGSCSKRRRVSDPPSFFLPSPAEDDHGRHPSAVVQRLPDRVRTGLGLRRDRVKPWHPDRELLILRFFASSRHPISHHSPLVCYPPSVLTSCMISRPGSFQPLSKLVVIVIMIRGRHRGLPQAIDRAICSFSLSFFRLSICNRFFPPTTLIPTYHPCIFLDRLQYFPENSKRPTTGRPPRPNRTTAKSPRLASSFLSNRLAAIDLSHPSHDLFFYLHPSSRSLSLSLSLAPFFPFFTNRHAFPLYDACTSPLLFS